MDQELLAALEKALILWIRTAEEPVMLTARKTILMIAQKIAEGDYDKHESPRHDD